MTARQSIEFAPDRPVPAHRFDRTIADRRYVIETALVDPDRWRACLVGVPGGPSALMPFYGETPEQAVEHLVDWLALVHRPTALRYSTGEPAVGNRG